MPRLYGCEADIAGPDNQTSHVRSDCQRNFIFSAYGRRLKKRLRTLIDLWSGRIDAQCHRSVRALYRSERLSNVPEVRGLRLLRRCLSPEQLAQFNAHGSFDVAGCHTGRRYRIYYAPSQNVELLGPFGVSKERLCFIPEGFLVTGDVALAQKIALENDEMNALAVANRLPPFSPSYRRRSRSLVPVV